MRRLQALSGVLQALQRPAPARPAAAELPAPGHAGALLGCGLSRALASASGRPDEGRHTQALSQRSLPLLQLAKREYAAALAQDGSLAQLLDEVEACHFGTRPSGGGLGDLLGSLLSG